LLLTCGCSWFRTALPLATPVYHARADAAAEPLKAGAAAVDITPRQKNLYLGGYGAGGRRSSGVHDSIYARALLLKRGEMELALVALDVVGVQREDFFSLRKRLEDIDSRHLWIAATHNHSGPDTLGLWGFPLLVSGQDRDYMKQLEEGILEALRKARASLRPAELASGTIRVEAEGFIRNLRRPGLVDNEVVVLHVREPGSGSTIATLVELGCHPEVLDRHNHLITADFPHYTVRRLEERLGGTAIYVSGALGGLVTPDLRTYTSGEREGEERTDFEEAARIGHTLAISAEEVVASLGEYESEPDLALWHTPLFLQCQNWRYGLLRWTGILNRRFYGKAYVESEVNLWQVGELRMVTVPGEITPDLGLRIKANAGHPAMLMGLANDMLGYLLPEHDFDLKIYRYERTLCVGRKAGDRIRERLLDLFLMAGAPAETLTTSPAE
ncbi:MAG: neutral/alkaline non-lysosomal ceramidase N-terminal domain-containing protein, partial [Planctomycetota bacterium]